MKEKSKEELLDYRSSLKQDLKTLELTLVDLTSYKVNLGVLIPYPLKNHLLFKTRLIQFINDEIKEIDKQLGI